MQTSAQILEDAFVFPASFAQRRLWFLDQLDPGGYAYNIPAAYRINGALNREAFHQSLNEIAQRHETLRTAFGAQDGEPMQIILPSVPSDFVTYDLTHLPRPEQEIEVERLITAHARQPFDLARAPLARAGLIQLADDEHIFLLTMHHIIADGWSLEVFFHELSALYPALASNQPAPLAEPPIQYADFAEWQEQWFKGPVREQQLAYWRTQLAGAPTTLNIPTDHTRPAAQTTHGAVASRRLPGGLTAGIAALAQGEGMTPYMVLLAGFQLLMGRYSGQRSFLVGSPIAGRTRPELEPLIGCFINTLVLRADLGGQPSGRGLLRRVRETCLGAYAHQDLPFELLVDDLQPERDLSRGPLVQVTFNLSNVPLGESLVGGLRFNSLLVHSGTAKNDLSLVIMQEGGDLIAFAEYNRDLFEAATIERLLSHYQTLLEGLVAAPDAPALTLPLLTAAEYEELVVARNATAAEYDLERPLHAWIEDQVDRTPDAIAARRPEAPRSAGTAARLAYRDLNEQANRLARHLRDLGVGPESRVALCLERSPAMLVAILAILKAGGAFVPLDPAFPTDRMAYVLEDSGARIVLSAAALRDRLPAGPAIVCLDEDAPRWAEQAATNLGVAVASGNLAYMIYTSGSTGRPKGVQIPHRAIVNYLLWARDGYDLARGNGAPVHSSIAADAMLTALLTPLLAGTPVVFFPGESALADLGAALPGQGPFTLVKITPSQLEAMTNQLSAPPRDGWVTTFVIGAEALRGEMLAAWQTSAPSTRHVNEYGPTETVVGCAIYAVPHGGLATGAVPIGRPIANLRMYVLDAAMQPVPVGVPGELYIGGAGVGRGYHDRPALTAEKFVPDPFAGSHGIPAGGRLYRTGDVARWLPDADGNIEYLGRNDDQVKIRGYRVELGEVAGALNAHPAVLQSVVLAQPDPQGSLRLAAYVVRRPGQALTAQALRADLRAGLPEYMVPSVVTFLDELPLLPNGKVNRQALSAMIAERAAGESGPVAPRTPLETAIARIWQEVLGVPTVGIDDNFFALGGHSLLATRVVARLRSALGREIALRGLFESQTIAALAAALEVGEDAGLEPIAPLARNQPLPLSFTQQRFWFLHQLDAGGHLYNNPLAYALHGPLNVPALEASLGLIVGRHESLRTRIEIVGDEPFQRIEPDIRVPLTIHDVDAGEVADRAARLSREPFDLSSAPFFRAALLRVGPELHYLVVVIHHIIFDEWSLGLLLDELTAGYAAVARGEQPALAPLAIQYADYAAWQRHWLSGPVLEQQLDYWRAHLAGPPPPLALPTDRPRPPVPSGAGAAGNRRLSPTLATRIAALAQHEGMTPYMVLLAGFQLLMGRYSGQEDFVVGSPIANRSRPETEGLIGCFVNTLALRADLGGQPTGRALLRRVRETCLGAYAHQDLPFEVLVDALHPERDLSRPALVQVMFNFASDLAPAPQTGGIRFEPHLLEAGPARFDLSLSVEGAGEILNAELGYNPDLFDAATIDRMLSHYELLLTGLVAAPDTPALTLPMLTAAERETILGAWAAGPAAAIPAAPLHALLAEQAARSPAAPAVVFEESTLTYAELNERADRLAGQLRSLGVGADTPVGLCLDRSLELVVAILAVLKADGAYLPLDPAYPAERIGFMLEDSQAPVVITQRRYQDALPKTAAQIVCLDGQTSEPASAPAKISSAARPDNLAYVIYTSGSTGKPKGVQISHRAIVNHMRWMQQALPLQPGDRVLQKTPYSFDASVWEFFAPLLAGACLVLARPGGHRDTAYLVDAVRRHEISVLQLVPSALPLLLTEPGFARCASLRRLCSGGEALPRAVADDLRARLPGLEIINLYGPTETTIDSLWSRTGDDGSAAVPIGRPIANLSAYILDRAMQPVPAGVPGELHIGGAGLARGYHDRPALTAEKFVPDPFAAALGAPAGGRLYRTGDVARWLPDGNIEYLGRNDDQVKIRGYRVELGEVAGALNAHPAVLQSAVLAQPDSQGSPRLAAYVVRRAEHELTVQALRADLLARLPEHMVPSMLVFVDALPQLPNGKVNRGALGAAPPAVAGERAAGEGGPVAPRTPLETAIAGIWREVLGVPQVGIDDNFFELGGHSLLATRVVARLRSELQLDVPLRNIFETPTIVGLAETIVGLQISDVDDETDLLLLLAEVEQLSEAETRDALGHSPDARKGSNNE